MKKTKAQTEVCLKSALMRLVSRIYPMLGVISYNLPVLADSITSQAELTNFKRSPYRLDGAFRTTTAIENDERAC